MILTTFLVVVAQRSAYTEQVVEHRTQALRQINLELEQAVAKRRAIAKKLRESQGLFNKILSHMSDAIVVVDRDFRFTYWNKAMEMMTQYSMEDVEKN